MLTKKTTTPPAPPARNNIENTAANEHTRAAVEALADAAARNAEAIAEIARALQPGTAPVYGIYLEG